MINIRQLLEEMLKRKGSDLHLTVGLPPMLRIDGQLRPTNYEILKPETCQQVVYSLLTEKQKQQFETTRELDFAFGIKNLSRFRANVFLQRGRIAIAIRQIPYEIHSFKKLGLPPIIGDMTKKPRGLILVTGPTGSGKSTTLAAMIDKINRERRQHIITIEDPIEFVHPHQKCVVNQREVHSDTLSITNALRSVLRQDPDVILIGEMRDLETVAAALTVAETGHLTFGTLHTNSTAETINRVIDVFPANHQPQIRAQLAFVLQAVLTQQLIQKRGGGRVVACEIMICTTAIRAVIRDDKVHQIYSLQQAGTKHGMLTMNQSLANLFNQGLISKDELFVHTSDPKEIERLTGQRIKD
ncbi:MAG: type IV pili twitching motility protein PilT [Candidatus Cloacimonetes bacterium 4572_55]|nr:MAG: type IV pili twitching motility protein PilT [Candidatus Cloacimonetes bacterium 4572_55]